MRDWYKHPGTVVCKKHIDALTFDESIEIVSADPVVLCDEDMLEQLHTSPWARFHDDDLITFDASNRSLTYRIGEHDFLRRGYLLVWPD